MAIYEENPKHGARPHVTSKGVASKAPQNGQAALDDSIQVKTTSPRRIGVDKTSDEIVVLDEHLAGAFSWACSRMGRSHSIDEERSRVRRFDESPGKNPMKYEEIRPVSKEHAEETFLANTSEAIVPALLGVTWHLADWAWVQDQCLHFLDSPLPEVRNAAIACLGHLARIHHKLDAPKVLEALARKRSDSELAGRIDDAMEDIEMFVSPS